MLIFRIVLLAGILFTALLVAYQIKGWRRSTLSVRQRTIRVASGVTLVLILCVVLLDNVFGVVFVADTHAFAKEPRLAIAYLSLIAGLACLLLLLALLDIHETLNVYKRERIETRERLRRKDGRS
jgi:hypothetical protein